MQFMLYSPQAQCRLAPQCCSICLVSESLLPQECEMESVKKCITVNPCYITMKAWLTVVIYCVTVNSNHSVEQEALYVDIHVYVHGKE